MIRVEIDPASRRIFRKTVDDYSKKIGKNVEEGVIELVKSGGKQLAQKVPPFGISAQIGKKFQGSVAKQVNRAVRAGNVGVVSGSTAEQVHRAARDGKGQVPKLLKTTGRRVRNPIPVRDKEQHIDRKQEAAGTAKGAWIAAANAVGGKKLSGIPRWISRHMRNGSARLTRKGISTECELTNSLRYINRLQPPNLIKSALQAAYQNTLRRMERIINKP